MLKVTLPSPGLFSQFWDERSSTDAYATLEDFLWAVAAILREEVVELARRGATYLQLDAPHYPLLLDERWRAFYGQRGSVETWLDLDNHVIDAAPDGVTFGLTFAAATRGAAGSSREATSRSGEDLPGASVPAGCCSSTTTTAPAASARCATSPPTRSSSSGSCRPRRRPASRPTTLRGASTTHRASPLEQLALSPQCGFGTSVVGNALSRDDQWAKLRTIAETAALVWH